MKNLSLLIPTLAFATIANAATLTFDFESGTAADNQKTNNFRSVKASGSLSQTDPADGGEPNNDWLAGSQVTGGSEWTRSTVAVYDTTPTNASDARQGFGNGQITVDFRMATGAQNQAVGIYFYTANNQNLFARFSVSTVNGAVDRINLSANGLMNGGNGSEVHLTPTTYSATSGTTTLANSGVENASSAHYNNTGDPTWFWVTVVYTPGATANTSTLSLAYKANSVNDAPSFSASVVVPDTYKVIDPSLGLFLYNNLTPTVKIDDLTITYGAIPEPSTYGILLAGIVGGVVALKRKRRV